MAAPESMNTFCPSTRTCDFSARPLPVLPSCVVVVSLRSGSTSVTLPAPSTTSPPRLDERELPVDTLVSLAIR
jgi:hypothetical protein